MPTKELAIDLYPPVEGINLAVDEFQLGDKEALDIANFELDEYGLLSVPLPDKSIGAINGSAGWLAWHVYQVDGATTRLIVHLTDGTVRVSTNAHTTSTTASWTTIVSGMSTTVPFKFVTAFGYCYFSNGVDDLRRYDGTTVTNYASAPKVKHLALWKDALWGSGVSANPDRVYQSDPGDGTSWPALNFVDVEKGAGYGVSALLATDTALVVFKFTKIHLIYDPIEYLNRILDDGKGCIAQNTIVNHHGSIYYLSHLGFCRFYTDGVGEVVSQKIGPVFDQFTSAGNSLFSWNLVPNNFYFCAWSFGNYIALSIVGDSARGQFFHYYPDLPGKPWLYAPKADEQRVGITMVSSGYRPYVFTIAIGDTTLYRRYDPAGSGNKTAYWYTKWFDFGESFHEKLIHEIEIFHRGVLTVQYERDGISLTDTTPQVTALADNTVLKPSNMYVEIYGRMFRFKISVTSAGAAKTQVMGAGVDAVGPTSIKRYEAAIGRIRVRARKLGDMAR